MTKFSLSRATPFSSAGPAAGVAPQVLAQPSTLSSLAPGSQLQFPDAFGGTQFTSPFTGGPFSGSPIGGGLFGGSFLQNLFQSIFQGIFGGQQPGAGAQAPQAQGSPATAGGPPRPMRQSQPSGWSHPISAVRDRYHQFQGKPLDGDARASAQDGLQDKAVPHPDSNGAAPSAADNKGDVHVKTTHLTQARGSSACKVMSDQVVRSTGGNPGASRIEVATSRPGSGGGRSATVNVDPAQMQKGMDRINSELDKGHAVEVGLAHDGGGNHNDGITDHFVAITGRGTDDQGRRYYTFQDPATSAGTDTDPHCRFYVDPDTGGLYRPSSSNSGNKWLSMRYEVTTVR